MSSVHGKQPQISNSEWNTLQDGGKIRISPQKRGQGMVSALGDFYEENTSVFTDNEGQGLTTKNKKSLYDKLVEIYNRNHPDWDLEKVSLNQEIYFTKSELTELAEAAGYSVKGTNEHERQEILNTVNNEILKEIAKQGNSIILNDDLIPKVPKSISIKTTQEEPQAVNGKPIQSAPTPNANELLKDKGTATQTQDAIETSEITVDAPATSQTTKSVDEVTAPHTATAKQDNAPIVQHQNNTFADMYSNIDTTSMTMAQFKATCKQIEASEDYKKLPFGSPERTAYDDWVRKNLDNISSSSAPTVASIPKAGEENYTDVEQLVSRDRTDVADLPKAFLKRKRVSTKLYRDMPEAQKNKLRAQYAQMDHDADIYEMVGNKSVAEILRGSNSNGFAPIESNADSSNNTSSTVSETSDTTPTSTDEPIVREETTHNNNHTKVSQSLLDSIELSDDSVTKEALIASGKKIIAKATNGNDTAVNSTLGIIRTLSPDEFVQKSGASSAEEYAKKFNMSKDDFANVVKNLDKDTYALFLGYNEYCRNNNVFSKPEEPKQNPDVTPDNTANVTSVKTPPTQTTSEVPEIKPTQPQVTTPTPTREPVAATKAENTPPQQTTTIDPSKDGAQGAVTYIASRNDLQDKTMDQRYNILKSELQELEKKPNADKAEIDKLRKAVAYCTPSWNKFGYDASGNHYQELTTTDGQHVVAKLRPDATGLGPAYIQKDADGNPEIYGVKYQENLSYKFDTFGEDYYKLDHDWSTKLPITFDKIK